MSLLPVRPSLALLFDRGDFNDDIISFIRASEATYFDQFGILRTAAINEPRLDYDPVTGELKGFLIEESRTNYWSNSENPVSNVMSTPYGDFSVYTLNNSNLEVTTFNGVHSLRFLAKKIGGGIPTITNSSGSGDLSIRLNGNSSAGNGAIVTDIGNDWYLIEVKNWTSGAFDNSRIENLSGTDVYVTYIQDEEGAFLTSYIPTTGATATRASEIVNIEGSYFTDFYNEEEGTFLVDFKAAFLDGNSFIIDLVDSANQFDDSLQMYIVPTSTNEFRVLLENGNVTQVLIENNFNGLLNDTKAALRYDNNNIKISFYANGSLLGEDESYDFPYTLDRLEILRDFSGHAQRIIYYPKALSDQQLQDLTSEYDLS